MKISIIAAMANNRVIGIDNSLPWKLPSDMKWFRQHTLGKPIVMGRKTFESFGGRTLPDRPNIIITRDEDYKVEGAIVTHSMQQAARVSQRTAYFHLGYLIEVGETTQIFTSPRHELTEDYITGRFG